MSNFIKIPTMNGETEEYNDSLINLDYVELIAGHESCESTVEGQYSLSMAKVSTNPFGGGSLSLITNEEGYAKILKHLKIEGEK